MNLPPLAALRAFEAAARHLSFTRAGAELGMTQAAVSYQIKLLEERLGSALFLRRPKGLELTRLGQSLARPTTDAFDLLRESWTAPDTGTTLAISAFASFAGNWLAPRIGRFQMAHPDLAVRIDSANRPVDFAREEFDVGIRYGKGDWPGLTAEFLMPVEFTPMLSPALAARHRLDSPADIVPLQWIDPSDPDWAIWLTEAGVTSTCDCTARPGLNLGTQVHEARVAMAGDGVALLTPRFFRLELATGQLVQPFAQVSSNGNAYWLIYPPARRNRKAIRDFRRFLQAEIAADG